MSTPHRILLVDDSPIFRDYVQTRLEMERFVVYPEHSRIDALRTLMSTPIDLAVTDIRMETTDSGYLLCREIRKISDVPIILYSAYEVTMASRRRALEEGATTILTTAHDPKPLIDTIRFLLTKEAPACLPHPR